MSEISCYCGEHVLPWYTPWVAYNDEQVHTAGCCGKALKLESEWVSFTEPVRIYVTRHASTVAAGHLHRAALNTGASTDELGSKP